MDADAPDSSSSPFHAAVELRRALIDSFGDAVDEPGFPLFPDANCDAVPAAVMLKLIEDIAAACGEELINKAGRRRFGKHSWRATGAVFLAESGIEVMKITLIGRWHCSVVLHYTRTSPIADIAGDMKRVKFLKDNEANMMKVQVAQRKVREMVDASALSIASEVKVLQDRIQLVEEKAIPAYVLNRRTKRWHRILTSYTDSGSDAVAWCGFAFAKPGALTKFTSTIPTDATRDELCGTCLGELRATKPEH